MFCFRPTLHPIFPLYFSACRLSPHLSFVHFLSDIPVYRFCRSVYPSLKLSQFPTHPPSLPVSFSSTGSVRFPLSASSPETIDSLNPHRPVFNQPISVRGRVLTWRIYSNSSLRHPRSMVGHGRGRSHTRPPFFPSSPSSVPNTPVDHPIPVGYTRNYSPMPAPLMRGPWTACE